MPKTIQVEEIPSPNAKLKTEVNVTNPTTGLLSGSLLHLYYDLWTATVISYDQMSTSPHFTPQSWKTINATCLLSESGYIIGEKPAYRFQPRITKTGKIVYVLRTPKDFGAAVETEGAFAEFGQKLAEKGIDSAEAVRLAWKKQLKL